MIEAIRYAVTIGIVVPVCLVVWALAIPTLVFVYRAWKDSRDE